MKLVYVFDYMDDDREAYVFRAPLFIARLACRLSWRTWDYAETPAGY